MTTGTSTPSSSHSGSGTVTPQPELSANDSYFPSNTTTSSSSSTVASSSSSSSSNSSISSRPAPPTKTASHVGPNPLSPLDREHSLPTDELDVEKQLAKPPLPRSLHSSLRAAAAAERKNNLAAGDDAETRAMKLAEAKRVWASWAN